VIEVRVGEEDMSQLAHLLHAEISHTGAAIDKNILINQKGGGSSVAADTTTAPQNSYLHGLAMKQMLWLCFRIVIISKQEGTCSRPRAKCDMSHAISSKFIHKAPIPIEAKAGYAFRHH
jgi:hypothetical protein